MAIIVLLSSVAIVITADWVLCYFNILVRAYFL